MSSTHYFLLRRLHSLLGVFPLGVFLFNHLLTNSSAIISAKFFEEKVALIHMLGPALPIVEALFIFIPLSIHIALGIYIAMQAKHELGGTMPYGRNYAYSLQRWSGWLATVYIAWHVIHLRFLHDMDAEPFSVELGEMFASTPQAFFYIPFYLLGGLCTIYHFANGLCTFCMTWGITIGPRSQKMMAYAASGVGALLTLMLLTSMVAFNKSGREYLAMDEAGRTKYVAELRAVHHHTAATESPSPLEPITP